MFVSVVKASWIGQLAFEEDVENQRRGLNSGNESMVLRVDGGREEGESPRKCVLMNNTGNALSSSRPARCLARGAGL